MCYDQNTLINQYHRFMLLWKPQPGRTHVRGALENKNKNIPGHIHNKVTYGLGSGGSRRHPIKLPATSDGDTRVRRGPTAPGQSEKAELQ